MFNTPGKTPCHARHRMQAVAMTLACLGMLGTVHAQDTSKENLTGVYDATVARTASDAGLGTVSATFNVTGSSNVRGIWGKSGTLSIDAIAEDAVFNVSSTRNNAFGIDTSSGVNLDIGTLAGTFNISAANTNATGIRSYGKILSIRTITEDALISITANFSSNGIYAYQGRLDIGTMAGKISVELGTGNYARGLYAYGNTMDYQGPRYKDVNIGTFSSTGTISAVTNDGYGARGIQSNYGQVNISRLDGQITATSGSGDTSEDFSAIGIEARENITLGTMGATGTITATTNGTDAYGIYAGEESGSQTHSNITLGNVNGAIRANAMAGTAAGAGSTGSVTVGDINGTISGASTGTAAAYGLLAEFSLATGTINGTVSAATAGNTAAALMGGAGITATIGSTGILQAAATGADGMAYALYSGSTTGSGFYTENTADNITVHAGASISGIWELGGSGKEGSADTITLLSGTEADPGLFDYTVQTTVNTNKSDTSTHHSSVTLNVGSTDNKANWTISTEKAAGLLNRLNVGYGSAATLTGNSQILREGAVINNMGTLSGNGTLTIAEGMTLLNGTLVQNAAGTALEVGFDGLNVNLDLAQNATVGATVLNTTDSAWVVTLDQIKDGIKAMYGSKVQDFQLENYRMSYRLQGQVFLGEGKPIVVNPGESIYVGEGSKVIIGENLPEHGIVLEGGEADLSQSDAVISSGSISGTSGHLTLAASDEKEQTLNWEHSGTVGYSASAANGGAFKNLNVTGEGMTVVATGSYAAENIVISNNATLVLDGRGASLGVAGGTLQLGQAFTRAANPGHLVLNGSTVLSDVDTNNGSTVSGSGTFKGEVTYYGSEIMIGTGSSAGYHNYEGGLNAWGGVQELTFIVNGTTAADAAHTGADTYSQINVSSSYYVDGAHVNVVIGDNLLFSKEQIFSLSLVNLDPDTVIDPDGSLWDLTSIDPTLKGRTDLVTDTGFTVSDDGLHLIFNGKININAVKALRGEEASRIANTLWSSVRVVDSFAHTAASQLDFRGPGARNIWFSGLGDFMNVSSTTGASGFDYKGGGYAVGMDYAWTKNWISGAAFGQTFGSFHSADKQFKADQDGLMLALYQRYHRDLRRGNSLDIDGYFTYGNMDNDVDGTLGSSPTTASWNDDVYGFGLKGTWNIRLSSTDVLKPFAGIEFLHGSQGSFGEHSDSGTAWYRDGSVQNWSVPAGLTWQKQITVGKGQYLLPQVTVAYAGDVSRRNASVKTDAFGTPFRVDGVHPGRHALIVHAGLNWVISSAWSAGAFYHLEQREHMTNQSVNATVRYSF
ncbi:autotransporter outer membrane beta-barrel domain-containing protein [uncultured Akkermansia sp.]|uniref:autotransporter outer membrane beta-barrel domain-containing protein n=1 Tax=uncultured Akkermansia sp. TaxID=512294 RepID=UPI0025D916E7|nr:autotransporter outer membrane beta-barrel domain-containing protein [uncultured Akkermansia sp.]